MKRKRYSVEQSVAAVNRHALDTPVTNIVRKLGIVQATPHRRRGPSGPVTL